MKLKVVATYPTEFEAVSAKNVLSEGGIESYIESAASITALSYIGTALSGVRLVVRADDEISARQLLADTHSTRSNDRWSCDNCDEVNEPNFDICWRCSSERPPISAIDNSAIAQTKEANEENLGESATELQVRKAWFAAVLGCMIPAILTAYSVWLLFTLDERLIMSRKLKIYYRLAWAINFIVLGLWVSWIRSVFQGG